VHTGAGLFRYFRRGFGLFLFLLDSRVDALLFEETPDRLGGLSAVVKPPDASLSIYDDLLCVILFERVVRAEAFEDPAVSRGASVACVDAKERPVTSSELFKSDSYGQ